MCLGAEARAANKAAKQKYEHQLAIRKRNWMNTVALTHVERIEHEMTLDAAHVGLGNAYAERQEKYGAAIDEAVHGSETDYQTYVAQSKGAQAAAAGRTGRSIARMQVVDYGQYLAKGSRRAWQLTRNAQELSKEGAKAAAEARQAQLASFAQNNILKNPDLAPPIPVKQNETLAAIKDGLSIVSSVATIATPFAVASTKKLKDNIVKIGRSIAGHNIYKFNYKGDSRRYVGVIAEEIQQSVPEAVVTMPNGFLGVIYDSIDVNFHEVPA